MKQFRRIIGVFIALLLAASFLAGCSVTGSEHGSPVTEEGFADSDVVIGAAPGAGDTVTNEDIVVLYTNDVHCAVNEGIGYAGVAALKQDLLEQYAYVTLVDCGDHTQGGGLGSFSKGLNLVEIMNKAGYDYATLGNHEFDFGLEAIHTNMMTAGYRYLCATVQYNGKETDPFFGMTPYDIVNFGGTKLAFIGATTPDTEISTLRSNYEENGETVVDFNGESIEGYCKVLQTQVDECRKKGADYVILLAHLGFDEESSFCASKVIADTEGIDVVLDGHSHTFMEADHIANKNGEPVLHTSTGTKFQSVGQLTITKDGEISTKLLTEYDRKDRETQEYIDKLNEAYDEALGVTIGSTDFDLSIEDENGIRMIRTRETNLSDFVTDAFRTQMETEIALVHGGTIRANLETGDITLSDCLTVFPFFNEIQTVSLKGSTILDALEMGAVKVEKEYSDGTNAIGENASFLHVSGLRYSVDTQVASTVEKDAQGNFVKVAGERRVKDVYVEKEDGSTEPLDPERYYSAAVSAFLLGGGDGMTMFEGTESLGGTFVDNELLIAFIQALPEGKVPKAYRRQQGRITVK